MREGRILRVLVRDAPNQSLHHAQIFEDLLFCLLSWQGGYLCLFNSQRFRTKLGHMGNGSLNRIRPHGGALFPLPSHEWWAHVNLCLQIFRYKHHTLCLDQRSHSCYVFSWINSWPLPSTQVSFLYFSFFKKLYLMFLI